MQPDFGQSFLKKQTLIYIHQNGLRITGTHSGLKYLSEQVQYRLYVRV